MRNFAAGYFLRAQAGFCVGLLICIALQPEGWTANGGISHFSGSWLTLLPYALSLLYVAWNLLRVADLAKHHGRPEFRAWCLVLAVVTVVLVVVPFAINSLLETVHAAISIVLFLAMLSFIGFQAAVVRRDLLNFLLLLLAILAIVITLAYLNPIAGYLIIGEILFELVFFMSIFRYAATLDADSSQPA